MGAEVRDLDRASRNLDEITKARKQREATAASRRREHIEAAVERADRREWAHKKFGDERRWKE